MVLAYKLEDLGLTTLSEVFTFFYGFSTIIAILLFFWYISENQYLIYCSMLICYGTPLIESW